MNQWSPGPRGPRSELRSPDNSFIGRPRGQQQQQPPSLLVGLRNEWSNDRPGPRPRIIGQQIETRPTPLALVQTQARHPRPNFLARGVRQAGPRPAHQPGQSVVRQRWPSAPGPPARFEVGPPQAPGPGQGQGQGQPRAPNQPLPARFQPQTQPRPTIFVHQVKGQPPRVSNQVPRPLVPVSRASSQSQSEPNNPTRGLIPLQLPTYLQGVLKETESQATSTPSQAQNASQTAASCTAGDPSLLFSSTGGIKPAHFDPDYLHSNSTSHTWAFSAIAELVDNAYDPDVAAKHLSIDLTDVGGTRCMVFQDDGNGMTPKVLHKMLSLGYSDKKEVRGHKPIGRYGNGFKSGSMRLGKDVMVFTKCKEGDTSAGMLSQTYLKTIGAQTVLVPIITWDAKKQLGKECGDALKDVTKYSLFGTARDLLRQFQYLDDSPTGTRIIIWNLKTDEQGRFELDFDSTLDDFINSEHHVADYRNRLDARVVGEYLPKFRRSLREYISILYHKPRLQVTLRGKRVRTKKVTWDLKKKMEARYKPNFLDTQIQITFGFSKTESEDFGMMLYHNKRLIQAYVRVGPQKKTTPEAVGIVGVVEADFLEPTHNKQEFNQTAAYRTFIQAMGSKLRIYWQEQTDQEVKVEEQVADRWTWAQCDKCTKWRRLTDVLESDDLPNKWYCHMNKDPSFNRCDITEEAEDCGEEQIRLTQKKATAKRRASAPSIEVELVGGPSGTEANIPVHDPTRPTTATQESSMQATTATNSRSRDPSRSNITAVYGTNQQLPREIDNKLVQNIVHAVMGNSTDVQHGQKRSNDGDDRLLKVQKVAPAAADPTRRDQVKTEPGLQVKAEAVDAASGSKLDPIVIGSRSESQLLNDQPADEPLINQMETEDATDAPSQESSGQFNALCVKELTSKWQKMKASKEQLEAQLQTVEIEFTQERAKMAETNQKLSMQLEEAAAKNTKLSQQLAQLCSQLERAKQNLSKQLEEAAAKNIQLLQHSDQQCSEQEETKRNLSTQLEEAAAKNTQLSLQLSEQRSQLEESERDQSKQLQVSLAKNSQLNQQLSELEASKKKLSVQLEETAAKNSRMTRLLFQQCSERQGAKQDLSKRLEDADAKNYHLKKAKKDLAKQLEELSAKNLQLKDSKFDIFRKLEEADAKNSQLKDAKHVLSKKLEEVAGQNCQLSTTVDKAQSELKISKMANKKLTEQIVEMKRRRSNNNNDDQQHNQLAEARRQMSDLRGNVCQLVAILLPELDIGDSTEVDDIVKEVIKVNVKAE